MFEQKACDAVRASLKGQVYGTLFESVILRDQNNSSALMFCFVSVVFASPSTLEKAIRKGCTVTAEKSALVSQSASNVVRPHSQSS